MPDVARSKSYIIEKHDDTKGWTAYDAKVNEDSAERIADVTSQSRKTMMRVMHNGNVIHNFDRREKTKKKQPDS